MYSDPNITDVEAEYFNIFENYLPPFIMVEKLKPEYIYFSMNGIQIKVEDEGSTAPPIPAPVNPSSNVILI